MVRKAVKKSAPAAPKAASKWHKDANDTSTFKDDEGTHIALKLEDGTYSVTVINGQNVVRTYRAETLD